VDAETNGNFISGPYAFNQSTYANQAYVARIYGDIGLPVPEPTSVGVLALTATTFLVRRSRQRQRQAEVSFNRSPVGCSHTRNVPNKVSKARVT
jgi:hypothetical protein